MTRHTPRQVGFFIGWSANDKSAVYETATKVQVASWHQVFCFISSIFLKFMLRSQSNSMHVMKEVYRALYELGFLWRNISFFRIRVKMNSKRNPGRYEKMNITLYRSPRCSERSPGISRNLKLIQNRLRLPAGLFIVPDGKRARAVGR